VSDSDLDGLTETEQEPVERRPYWGSKGKFLHENVGDDLIELHHARFIEGMPAIWDGFSSRYRIGYDAWDAAIVDLVNGTTTNQRREVTNYLRIRAPHLDQGDTHLVACANGVIDPWLDGYDVQDEYGHCNGFIPNTPDLNIPNVLPVTWNPQAYDNATDVALYQFSCWDNETRAVLEEILAACVYRGRELQNMAVLIGSGGNGKSVFLRMVMGLLGRENVSTIDLRDIGRRFMQAPLVGKLANVGDDIADGIIEAAPLSIVKKIVTGDAISVEEKYRAVDTFRPYASLVFSANQFPRLADYTGGMLDRIHGVHFAADFRHNPDVRVTNIWQKLDTEQSRQYLLKLALARLPNLVSRGCFTPTSYSETMREAVLNDNDSVAYWIEADGIRQSHVDGRAVSEVYSMYRSFCENAGRKPVEQRAFTMRTNKRLDTFTSKDVYLAGRQVRGFHAH